jgi:glutamate synthase domain-containing protein 2
MAMMKYGNVNDYLFIMLNYRDIYNTIILKMKSEARLLKNMKSLFFNSLQISNTLRFTEKKYLKCPKASVKWRNILQEIKKKENEKFCDDKETVRRTSYRYISDSVFLSFTARLFAHRPQD